jgi:hypothetical protein
MKLVANAHLLPSTKCAHTQSLNQNRAHPHVPLPSPPLPSPPLPPLLLILLLLLLLNTPPTPHILPCPPGIASCGASYRNPLTLLADQRAAHFTHTPFVWERRHSEDFGAQSQYSGAPHKVFSVCLFAQERGEGGDRKKPRAQEEGDMDGILGECGKAATPPRTHSCSQS